MNKINFKPLLIIILSLIIFVFSFLYFSTALSTKSDMKNLETSIKLSRYISKLIHEVQNERGKCVGFISSSGKSFTSEFVNQFEFTNVAIVNLKQSISKQSTYNLHNNVLRDLNSALKSLENISTLRDQVLKLKMDNDDVIRYYSGINSNLLDTATELSKISGSDTLNNMLVSYSCFLHVKEKYGLIRATATIVIAKGLFENNNRVKLNVLIESSNIYRDSFLKYATPASKEIYKSKLQGNEVDEADRIIDYLINTKNISDLKIDAKHWFDVASYKMNILQSVDDYLLKELLKVLDFKLDSILKQIYLHILLGIFTFLFGIGIIIFYFNKENRYKSILIRKNNKLEKQTNELADSLAYLQSYEKSIDKNLIVTKTDLNGIITFANKNFYDISGYTEDEIIGHNHRLVRHPDCPDSLFEKMWETISSKRTWQGEIKNRHKDGSTYWLNSTVSPILDSSGNIIEYLSIRSDVTKLVEQQEKLKDALYLDCLTGLGNRNALLDEIESAEAPSIILIDIDNFSQINDFYGNVFGDEVIKELGKELQRNLIAEKSSKLFRLSGDEFAIICDNSDITHIVQHASAIIKKINSKPLYINGQVVSISVTASISQEKKVDLLPTANMSIKIARRKEKNLMVYSDAISLSDEYKNNIIWVEKIKEAISDDRISIFFQPIVNNSDGSIGRYEVLVRLIEKDGSIVTPYFFLDISKKAKLYKELTKIVIKKSFEAFKDNEYEFSLNITIDDMLDVDINVYIHEMLDKYNISHRVIFEIVEDESIEKFEDIVKFINSVKAKGCKIAIDDFGTGYSNFEYLMRLGADYIKIDGSIIKEVLVDRSSEIITSVIVEFAKKMGMQTIGEFVENEEIYNKLIELGVDKSQGYFFGAPQAELLQKKIF